MPRFARLFEAAEDTLFAYYGALAQCDLDAALELWLDEDLVSCITAGGDYLHGLEQIRGGLAQQFERAPARIEALETQVYDSAGTVVYTVAEAHRPLDPVAVPRLVFATYVLLHERGTWRIAHIHASPMPESSAAHFSARMRRGQGPLH